VLPACIIGMLALWLVGLFICLGLLQPDQVREAGSAGSEPGHRLIGKLGFGDLASPGSGNLEPERWKPGLPTKALNQGCLVIAAAPVTPVTGHDDLRERIVFEENRAVAHFTYHPNRLQPRFSKDRQGLLSLGDGETSSK
jgi:hypothetical protein